MALSLAASVAGVPFGLYRTFVLEARFGFNRTTPRTWLADRAKSLLVQAVLGVPLLYAVYAFMRFTGPLWWLWLFGFLVLFQLLVLWLYPAVIAPLFNHFSPLPDGPLRERLEALARDAGFRNRGLFVMDASRRSGHSNAYFTGILRPRIVLFDTLVARMSVDEAASVLAHEIGHYRAHHVQRRLAPGRRRDPRGAVRPLPARALAAAPRGLRLLRADAPRGGGALSASGAAPSCSGSSRSRRSCRAATSTRRIASRCGSRGAPGALKTALLRLTGENLSNLHPHPWYSAWHYSHPVLAERLAAIDRAPAPPQAAGST